MVTSHPLRVVFMGTPDFAVPALRAILQAGHQVIAVYTRPPAAKGRGQQIQKSPVHQLADEFNIPVYTPISLKKDPAAVAVFQTLAADVAVVAAYGLILPPAVLAAPVHGCLNIHASLLPRWRGASPIHHAILSGDSESGVTIMQMEEGLDTGPMVRAGRVPITPQTTTPILHDQLAALGADLIVSVLTDLAAGTDLPHTPQPDQGVTYAPMLTKDHARIDWTKPAGALACQVRAFDPWPGAVALLPGGQNLKILAAHAVEETKDAAPGTLLSRAGAVACGAGSVLQIDLVQAPSGKRMPIADLINGGHVAVGDRLG